MVNPEHLAILKQGVGVWNEWRAANPKLEPDLGEQNLRQVFSDPFAGADLSRTRFFRADMEGVVLADANLAHANLRLANLRGSCLAGVQLEHADLFSADLTGADLRGANLRAANVAQADLRGANLDDANLARTNLFGTVMESCSLRNVSLTAANLYGTQLAEADLDGATFLWSRLGRLDLGPVRGLEAVKHLGPSSVDVDTLVNSGALPSTFLIGLGVPQRLIDVLPTVLIAGAEEYYSTFISYSHTDKPFARRLHDQLQGKSIRCWLDEKKLKVGQKILDGVLSAIGTHERVVLCCSRHSLSSRWVTAELGETFEKEEREGREILLPLDLDGYLFDGWKGPLAERVRERLAADFTGWEQDNVKFEAEFERVVEALRAEEVPL